MRTGLELWRPVILIGSSKSEEISLIRNLITREEPAPKGIALMIPENVVKGGQITDAEFVYKPI